MQYKNIGSTVKKVLASATLAIGLASYSLAQDTGDVDLTIGNRTKLTFDSPFSFPHPIFLLMAEYDICEDRLPFKSRTELTIEEFNDLEYRTSLDYSLGKHLSVGTGYITEKGATLNFIIYAGNEKLQMEFAGDVPVRVDQKMEASLALKYFCTPKVYAVVRAENESGEDEVKWGLGIGRKIGD